MLVITTSVPGFDGPKSYGCLHRVGRGPVDGFTVSSIFILLFEESYEVFLWQYSFIYFHTHEEGLSELKEVDKGPFCPRRPPQLILNYYFLWFVLSCTTKSY